MRIGLIALGIGAGLVGGVVGTAAITLSQAIDQRIRGLQPSDAPERALEAVIGVVPEDDTSKARANQMIHWQYGTGWGVARGILAAMGLPPLLATALHWAGVQAAAMTVFPAMGLVPPVRKWALGEIALEMLHHAVYAAAAGATVWGLMRYGAPRPRPIVVVAPVGADRTPRGAGAENVLP